MSILRPAMPLLIAGVLAIDATPLRAEAPAEDAVWSCVREFARSLALNSPLDTALITAQSLRSCNAIPRDGPTVLRLLEPWESLSRGQVEKWLPVSGEQALAVVTTIVESVRTAPPQPVTRERFRGVIRPQKNEPDGGIWMNRGLTEEQTAEAQRPDLFLDAAGGFPR